MNNAWKQVSATGCRSEASRGPFGDLNKIKMSLYATVDGNTILSFYFKLKASIHR